MLHLFLLKGYAKSQINEFTVFEFFLRINFPFNMSAYEKKDGVKNISYVFPPRTDGNKRMITILLPRRLHGLRWLPVPGTVGANGF